MTVDYGSARTRKGLGLGTIVVAAAVVILAFVIGNQVWHRPGEIRKAEQWAVSGPPCQRVSPQVFQAQPVRIHHRFENDEITFGRGFGHVSCEDIVNDGGKGFGTFTECQFNAPGALQVTTSNGDAYFLTQGNPATVIVKNGAPTCVMAGKLAGH